MAWVYIQSIASLSEVMSNELLFAVLLTIFDGFAYYKAS